MAATYFQYGPEHEGPQRPGPDPWWQDSVFLHWYDPVAGIGGAHRIGYEPNQGDGQVCSWRTILTAEGRRFRRLEPALPLREVSDGFGGGAQQILFDAGSPHLIIDEPGCKADLHMTDFYRPIDLFPLSSGALSAEFAHRHLESTGRITGTIELDGRRYEVDGLAHRDHSWGVRHWEGSVLNARWCSGSFGPELSFCALSWHAVDDSIATFGFVVRDGVVTYASSADLIASFDMDGISVRGGEVTLHLPDEPDLTFRPKLIDGAVHEFRSFAWVDALCEIAWDGKIGYCDYQVIANPRDGRRPVGRALSATLADGLDQR